MADTVDHSGELGRPDPETAHTPAEFVAALRGLQSWTGEGLRQLEKRAKANGDVLPRSTVAAALARPTLPREDLVVALVSACGCAQDEVDRWAAARRRIAATTAASPAGLPTAASPAGLPAGQPVGPVRRRITRPVLILAAIVVGLSVAALATWSLGVGAGGAADDDSSVGANVGPPTTPPPTTPPPGRDQPCGEGWVCLYEHNDFNRHQDGRKLQFREDYWQWFGDYDFDDKMSSWKNNLERDVCLSQQWPVLSAWLRLPAGAAAISMEPGWDNAASGIKPGPCPPD